MLIVQNEHIMPETFMWIVSKVSIAIYLSVILTSTPG